MFDRYLDHEQRRLERLGESYQEQRRLLEQQQRRLAALRSIVTELSEPVSGTGLALRNRTVLRDQIGTLVQAQEQETALADLSCRNSLAAMRRQLGRVRGLEHVQAARAQAAQTQAARREQRGLDDWITARRSGSDH